MPNYGTALEGISVAIINAERKAQDYRSKSWATDFSTWSSQIWDAARPVMKEAAGSAAFDANAMRKEWQPIWRP